MTAPTTAAEPAGSVLRIARRRAKPHCRQAYEALVRGMFEDMRQTPGFISADLTPPHSDDGEYEVISRFTNAAALDAWDRSPSHAAWLQRLDAVAEGAPHYMVLSGLEAWFAPSMVPTNRAPPRWRMAVLTWLGIFPVVSLVLSVLAPPLGFLPFLPRTALLTAIIVVIMTYAVMPLLTRLARSWLIPGK